MTRRERRAAWAAVREEYWEILVYLLTAHPWQTVTIRRMHLFYVYVTKSNPYDRDWAWWDETEGDMY